MEDLVRDIGALIHGGLSARPNFNPLDCRPAERQPVGVRERV